MKNIKIYLLVILIGSILPACSTSNNISSKKILESFSIDEYYKNLEDLVESSDLIVEVKSKDDPQDFVFKNAHFTTNLVNVKEVVKGDVTLENQDIKLLQFSNIAIENNKKFLLFLKQYVGPVTENAYIVSGVYQGRFEISNDSDLKYSAAEQGGEIFFQEEFIELPLKEAKIKIKKIKSKG